MLPRILALFLLVLVGSAHCEEKTGFLRKTLRNDDASLSPYSVFVPSEYDGTKEYPVILFLYATGDSVGGKKLPTGIGLGTYIKANEKTFSYIVVFPEFDSKTTRPTWRAGSADGKRALGMLDKTLKDFKTDPQRVYLTGISTGGDGVWSLAAANPEKFAAIVPICGKTNTREASKLKDVPCWVFHGDKDSVCPIKESRDMVAAIKKAGGKPESTELAGETHACWDKVYAMPDLWKWLGEQKHK